MKTTKSKNALEILEQYNAIDQKVAELNKQKKELRNQVLKLSEIYGEQFKAGRFVAKIQTVISQRFCKALFIEKHGDDAFQEYTAESIQEKITIKVA